MYKFGYHYYIPRLVIIGQSELLPSCCLSCGLDILFHSNNNTGHSNLAAALIDTHSHTLAVRQRERGSLPFVSFPVSWLQAIFPNAFKELSLMALAGWGERSVYTRNRPQGEETWGISFVSLNKSSSSSPTLPLKKVDPLRGRRNNDLLGTGATLFFLLVKMVSVSRTQGPYTERKKMCSSAVRTLFFSGGDFSRTDLEDTVDASGLEEFETTMEG